jgi:glutathione S-transferase
MDQIIHTQKIGHSQFFGNIPALIRGFVTKQIRKQARAQVIARHTVKEQLARAYKDITTIADILDDKPFLFGATATAADASVIPMLKAIAGSPTPTLLSNRVNNDAVLTAYLERGCAALFPAA